MSPAPHPESETVERAALIHREMFQLVTLILVAVAAVFLTRAVAANNRDMNLRDAAEWYRRGQQAVAAGRLDDAIDSLRRATVRDRNDKRYLLALARALALKRDDDAAMNVLLTLRESSPEDREINLQLARLAADRHDVTQALRFYHSALYAPWPSAQAGARRGVRLELIRFLLGHEQSSRALSELLALTTDLPDDVSLRLEVAQLFAGAGDSHHALDQFRQTLRLAPDNAEALAGAGQAAFQLGDYSQAQSFLRRARPESRDLMITLEVAKLVLSNDPLANRIGSAERRRRLIATFSYARERLRTCLEQRSNTPSTNEYLALQNEEQDFADQLKRPGVLEQDAVEAGVDLINRVEQLVTQNCGPPTAFDRALFLIARQHGSEAR